MTASISNIRIIVAVVVAVVVAAVIDVVDMYTAYRELVTVASRVCHGKRRRT